jgi:hypothetical protein
MGPFETSRRADYTTCAGRAFGLNCRNCGWAAEAYVPGLSRSCGILSRFRTSSHVSHEYSKRVLNPDNVEVGINEFAL